MLAVAPRRLDSHVALLVLHEVFTTPERERTVILRTGWTRAPLPGVGQEFTAAIV